MNPESFSAFSVRHLPVGERVRRGGFYTPEKIVDKVHQLIDRYKRHPRAVVFDNAAGGGAFIKDCDKVAYKAAECDPVAGLFLRNKLDEKNLFIGNAILDVQRGKYGISPSHFLIQIGNPPYNDVTSAYRNGKKGANICDGDLFDRDLGVSFLKSYNKLKADIVCVLHPLSYLIKEANFKRLQPFSDNYRIKEGVLFSSAFFQNVSRTHFPIVIALYERDSKGTTYSDIKNFKFSLIDEEKIFRLSDYTNVDSFIRKYPPKKTDVQVSDIGVYYHTFRDINSLIRNRGFHFEKGPHSIVVSLKELYKYTWLFAFKQLFRPKNLWLYGNLSPLGSCCVVKENKKLFMEYAFLAGESFFSKLNKDVARKIRGFYGIRKNKSDDFEKTKRNAEHLIYRSCLDLSGMGGIKRILPSPQMKLF